MENAIYVDFSDNVRIDEDYILVAAWNKYISFNGGVENKISLNDKGFFDNNFNNPYDAAWAASIGDWRWSDRFVYFDEGGYLTSFTHWDDKNSPIDMDKIKIDISNLINALK